MHIVLEHSADLLAAADARALMRALHETAAAAKLMNAADIKVRLQSYDNYLIGGGVQPFAHLMASMLEGRSDEVKLTLSKSLLADLCAFFPEVERLSVEIRDMHDASYKKRPYD